VRSKTYNPKKPRFPWKTLIYALVIAYLVIDLKVLHGPASQWIERKQRGGAENSPSNNNLQSSRQNSQTNKNTQNKQAQHSSKTLVASVNTIPITLGELDRAVAIAAYSTGKTVPSLKTWDRQNLYLRELEHLIADKLISQHSKLNPIPFDQYDYDAEQELARFKTTFVNEERFLIRLRALGMSLPKLKEQLRDKAYRSAWIEDKIAHAIAVGDHEVLQWFQQHQSSLQVPAQIRARQLFLNRGKNRINSQAAENNIRSYYGKLIKRLASTLFTMTPMATPRVLESDLGWHLIQVTEKQKTRPPQLEEFHSEITLLLQNQKRESAVAALLTELKSKANILYAEKLLQEYVGIENPAKSSSKSADSK